jgi:KDO2-lipid IV(A) lauroyltransferase
MARQRLVDYLVYLAVRLVVCLVQAMRLQTGQELAGWLAWLFSDVLRIRASVVDENLAHAFPQMSPGQRRLLCRRMWNHLFLLVLEVAHAPRTIHETNWRDYVTLRDHKSMVRTLLGDRPLLILTAHFGNFEVAGYVLGILGFPTYTVARPLDNPFLDRFINRFRSSTGQRMIPKQGGYDQIAEVLGRGGAMTFLADQYAGTKGCWVEFFGRPASAHKAIALLAINHDAPMAIAAARRLGRPLRIEMRVRAMADPRDAESRGVRDLTQWYTRQFESMIRETPGQYWWLHRRWKDTREAARHDRRRLRDAA